MGQDAVPVRPAARRLAGQAPAARIPSTPGRETGCPTGIRKPGASTSANATGGGWRNAAPWVCASNAGRTALRPGEVSARPASKEAGPPNAPDTRGPGGRGRLMAGAIPRAAAGWRARGTGDAGENDERQASVRIAGRALRFKAAPSARRAARNAGRRNGSSTPKGVRGGIAADAGRKSSTRLLRAPRARQGMQDAVRARTQRAGRAITAGAPGGIVWTAAPRRTQG